MKVQLSAGDRFGTQKVPERDTEEMGYIREQLFFRNLIAVFPVGDGSVRKAEDFIAAGPGHAFSLPEDSDLGSETHGNISFLSLG